MSGDWEVSNDWETLITTIQITLQEERGRRKGEEERGNYREGGDQERKRSGKEE